MYNHEPEDYSCPLCTLSTGGETDYNKRSDVIYEDNDIMVFTSPKWWVNNPGNVMVIPKQHVENLYDIGDDLLAKIQIAGKKTALAIKETYKCDGTSLRQHNEPHGGQDVWHFHLHVFPRWEGDELYVNHKNKSFIEADKRKPYADKLREYFQNQ